MALMRISKFAENPLYYNLPLLPTVLKEHEEIEALLSPYLVECYSLEVRWLYSSLLSFSQFSESSMPCGKGIKSSSAS
jgi:hypothetical protein